ncbi:MAG: 16S rRNA (guanine(966)-N(2))-methyltransferase RsmD, partial [Actinomycetes bacterium]
PNVTRIISGSSRGRRLRVPKSGTRPTSDRVREAVFSSLDHRLQSWSGLAVLDLFAGSGALALESLSRGAEQATAVDADKAACAVIGQNVAETGLQCTVVHDWVARWLARAGPTPYDVVFVDPPYEMPDGEVGEVLVVLGQRGWIVDGGIVVLERSAHGTQAQIPSGFEVLRERRFGDTIVRIIVWYFAQV